jgi:hypothetical protein
MKATTAALRVELQGANQPLVVSGDRTRLSAALTSLLHAAVREQGDPGVVMMDCSVVKNESPVGGHRDRRPAVDRGAARSCGFRRAPSTNG